MSVDYRDLENIALGDMSAASAQKVIASLLLSGDARAGQKVYTALRAWVWKALTERRRDGDLRPWYQLLRGLQTAMVKSYPVQSERMQVLYELIHESISVSEVIPLKEVLNRSHIAQILRLLLNTSGRVGRARVVHALNLKQANLTRVMALPLAAGLVSRTSVGKEVEYELTAEGMKQALRLIGQEKADSFGRESARRKPMIMSSSEKLKRKEGDVTSVKVRTIYQRSGQDVQYKSKGHFVPFEKSTRSVEVLPVTQKIIPSSKNKPNAKSLVLAEEF